MSIEHYAMENLPKIAHDTMDKDIHGMTQIYNRRTDTKKRIGLGLVMKQDNERKLFSS